MSVNTASANQQSSNGLSEVLQDVLADVRFQLSTFATRDDFLGVIQQAFGEEYDPTALEQIRQSWQSGTFELPPVEILPSSTLQGANGAYAAVNNTIYFSEEFLEANSENMGAIAAVWLEEIGHSIDAQINETDTPGDEGTIFSNLIQEKALSETNIQALKSEDDTVLINLGTDTVIQVEASDIPIFDFDTVLESRIALTGKSEVFLCQWNFK